MAPSPEHDNEPKAPDKTDKSDSADLRTNSDFLDDHLSSSGRDLDLQDSSVSTLDDSELKALLDEAINYKTPKDREGKSRIFKVLLQEAEEDERNARAASASGPQLARYYNAAARRQRGPGRRGAEPSVAVSATQGGSLQDLVQAGLYEVERAERCGGGRRSGGGGSRRRHHHQHPVTGRTVSVSARQREGGSLPSNVNAGAVYPSDLRLFTSDNTSTSTDTTPAAATATPDMVESTAAPQPPGESAPRPEYTVIDLTDTTDTPLDNNPLPETATPAIASLQTSGGVIEVAATPEETRGLLQTAPRAQGYSSTETRGWTPVETSEPEKDEPVVEVASSGGSRRHHSGGGAFDGVPRHQYFNPLEEALHHRIPRIRYTSRATLEVDGVSGAHGATTVDKGISFPQFQPHEGAASATGAASLQLDPEYNSVRCIVESGDSAGSGGPRAAQSAAIVPTQYRLLSVANPKIIQGVERFPQHHNDKKGLDENGNAVSTATTDSKKKKKCKVDRNVTVLKSENLPGHRADIIESIDLLVKYIEEDDATASKSTKHHHKAALHPDKKRARIKTKSEQASAPGAVVKKSNSLEEISKTKLEDLMSEDPKKLRVKKQSTSEDGDRRSWNTEEDLTISAETDFHVVTKKKKSKKRATKLLQQPTTYYHYQRIEVAPPPAAPPRDRADPQRRKSACSVPPSDKSADSSDVDSVHSLPAAGVHGAHQPSTSYADIARTNGGSSSASSNCSSIGPTVMAPVAPPPQQPLPALRSEHFPELCAEGPIDTSPLRLDSDFPSLGGTPRQTLPPIQPQIVNTPAEGLTRAPPRQTDFKLSDSVPNRTVLNCVKAPGGVVRRGGSSRPAVIILDDEQNGETPPLSGAPIQVSGLTFGFELNEQLLNDSDGDSGCGSPPPRGPGAPVDIFTARFVAPHAGAHLTETYNHDKIVTFVGLAWEDVVHQTNGKVQYYNGQ